MLYERPVDVLASHANDSAMLIVVLSQLLLSGINLTPRTFTCTRRRRTKMESPSNRLLTARSSTREGPLGMPPLAEFARA
eukprot:2963978-Pleurochrysis_carterae.AAC.1